MIGRKVAAIEEPEVCPKSPVFVHAGLNSRAEVPAKNRAGVVFNDWYCVLDLCIPTQEPQTSSDVWGEMPRSLDEVVQHVPTE